MAKSRGWSRYEPPQRPRTESGRLEDDQSPDQRIPASTKPSSRSSKSAGGGRASSTRKSSTRKSSTRTPSARKPASTTRGATSGRASAKVVWWGVLGSLTVLTLVIAVVAGVRGNDSDGPGGAYDTETLDETFIADGLDLAVAQAPEGSQPVGVELNEYELRVEYFDANRGQTKTLVRSHYDVDSDAYSIDVRKSPYDDYAPRPIDLERIEPSALIDAAEAALDDAEDPYSWSVEVSADYDTGAVSMVSRAYGDESSEITTPVR